MYILLHNKNYTAKIDKQAGKWVSFKVKNEELFAPKGLEVNFPKIVLRFCRLTLRRSLYFQGTSLRIVYGKIFALYKEVCLVMIYHICRRGEAEKAFAAGVYAPDSLQTEGFIHFSTTAQVVSVANRFYAADPDLVLLKIGRAHV